MSEASPRTRTVSWQDPAIAIAGVDGRTGLAFLRAIVAGDLPQAPISATLDFALVAADDGAVRFAGTPGESQYNPMGTVHGGWAATLLDSAMGAAVMSTLDATQAYTTAQLSVHLVRPITAATGEVVAEGRVVNRGSRLATAEATLEDGAGRLLAHGTTTCAIVPRRA
ncbi:MAG: PaaI family thioesterase [Kofleriaceae bacterium]|nr:PaaI family thioesterase [Myxococcales bacterium]MCB9559005.1 PaaI family thioesterase [Kofleriaceae bacterium]MCB9574717.1 PaaI family thioesterase [Kofleriaceae bacterium]